MAGKKYGLFHRSDFLKLMVYPQSGDGSGEQVGFIYVSENGRGGIIVNTFDNVCYLYDMRKQARNRYEIKRNFSGRVVPGSFNQCPGSWSRHLSKRERLIFSQLLPRLNLRTWKRE